MNKMCGGFGETHNATEAIQEISDRVKPQVEEKTNKKYEAFTAVKYRNQVVAGTNYLIKVHVGHYHYLHLLVYKDLSGAIRLSRLQENHSKDDPVEPF